MSQLDNDSPGPDPIPSSDMWRLATAALRGWRTLAAVLGATWLLTLALVLLKPREYRAEATLAAVSGRGGLGGAAGFAASLLGQEFTGGVQATPAFLVRLSRLEGVLVPVGLATSSGGERIVDRLAGRRAGGVALNQVGRIMRLEVATSYDIQSGLISVRVQHRDSALARRVVNDVVQQLSTVFTRASRAQASELRHAQEQRVDSARRRLQEAEQAYVEFIRTNRSVAPYSLASLEMQRVQRQVNLAQTVYTQAVMDVEAAVAKELEATPAVVVVDPPAAVLAPVPRNAIAKLALATLAALAVGMGLVVVRDVGRAAWRNTRQYVRDESAAGGSSNAFAHRASSQAVGHTL